MPWNDGFECGLAVIVSRATGGRFSDEVFLGAFGGLMREFLGLGGKEEGGSGLRRSGLRRSSRGKKSS